MNITIVYHTCDAHLTDRLLVHLSALRRDHSFTRVAVDGDTAALAAAVASADAVVVGLSIDMMESDFVVHECAQHPVVIGVRLRPCLLRGTRFAKLRVLPFDLRDQQYIDFQGRALRDDEDTIGAEVVRDLRLTLIATEAAQSKLKKPAATPAPWGPEHWNEALRFIGRWLASGKGVSLPLTINPCDVNTEDGFRRFVVREIDINGEEAAVCAVRDFVERGRR